MTTTTTRTTTEPLPSHRRRPRFGAVIACGLLVASCSSPAPLVDSSTITTVASPKTNPTPVASGDGASILDTALARYRAGYEFSSQVVVNGISAVTVAGRNVSGSSLMIIQSGDGEVEYLVIGPQQWARTPDGIWDAVSDSTTPPPLEPLSSPRSVQVTSESGTIVTLEAAYAAEVFQVSGPDLRVTLTIDAGWLTSARYSMDQGGATAAVETTFGVLSDTTPITAPSA